MATPLEGRGLAGIVRWMRFNLVGLIGTLLQLAILAACTHWTKFPYLLAVAIAVECTILHNFLWHERFTWRDRRCGSQWESGKRLLAFNTTNGGISLVGNLLLMRLLVEQFRLPILAANGVAILACSLLNFAVGDQFVFRRRCAW